MADPILVRFDDDVAKGLRERAHQNQKSIASFVNEAVKLYLDQLDRYELGSAGEMGSANRRFEDRLADAHQAIQKKKEPWLALAAILDCIELSSAGKTLVPDRVTWEEFLYVGGNDGDEIEARRLFKVQYDEVAQRDWTYYLRSCKTEDEAKAVWLRQRRRLGIPIPPEL